MDHAPPVSSPDLFEYALRLGDQVLVLGQRLSAWTGHGPFLEEDIALTNLSLDLFGQARAYLSYAGEVEGRGRSEDDLAFHRDAFDFRSPLLVEQSNGDFAATVARQFLFDAFHVPLLARLRASRDGRLAAIADKAVKEARYHLEHSRTWVVRLGDGTEESHRRMQVGLEACWRFTGELFAMDAVDRRLVEVGIAVDLEAVRDDWEGIVVPTLAEATLSRPEAEFMHEGGKRGQHTEHLGLLLAEMQFLPRAYPDAAW